MGVALLDLAPHPGGAGCEVTFPPTVRLRSMMPAESDPTGDPLTEHVPDRLPRVERPLEAHYSVEGARVPARVEDLSEGGAYLDTMHPLYVGTPLTLELILPDKNGELATIELEAEVVWTSPGLGAGLAFRLLDPDRRARLRFYLAAVLFGHL